MHALLPLLFAAQISVSDAMARVEAAQTPNRQGLDPFTLLVSRLVVLAEVVRMFLRLR